MKEKERAPLYDVHIDFDEASLAWRANKRCFGNGCYVYVCAVRGKNNNRCVSRCLPGEDYCKNHLNLIQKGIVLP